MICKNSWRVRVTLKNGDRWSKSVKTEEIGKVKEEEKEILCRAILVGVAEDLFCGGGSLQYFAEHRRGG